MTKKEKNEKEHTAQNPTDNLSENVTNEPILQEEIEKEEQSSDNTADELAELKDSYLRLMAEYDNYRKRTVKEKAELIKNGGERVLVGLLPVVDDFERALQNLNPESDIEAVTEGVNLIYSKFISFLKQNGVTAIEATGTIFDDELYDAIATIPAPSSDDKGKVIDCVQKGYTLNDKVIRHAKVVVAG